MLFESWKWGPLGAFGAEILLLVSGDVGGRGGMITSRYKIRISIAVMVIQKPGTCWQAPGHWLRITAVWTQREIVAIFC